MRPQNDYILVWKCYISFSVYAGYFDFSLLSFSSSRMKMNKCTSRKHVCRMPLVVEAMASAAIIYVYS